MRGKKSQVMRHYVGQDTGGGSFVISATNREAAEEWIASMFDRWTAPTDVTGEEWDYSECFEAFDVADECIGDDGLGWPIDVKTCEPISPDEILYSDFEAAAM